MISKPFWALALVAGASAAPAQTPAVPPSFANRVAQADTILRVDGTELKGAGAAVLADAVADARYVLVGEAHFSREIPRLTVGLCGLMARGGLHALAVESGPEAARIVEQNVRRPDRAARLSAFLRTHPDAIAFQNNAAESDMAAACAARAGQDFRVWGLDQEFFGATGMLLDAMADARPGAVARAAIDRLRAADRAATTKALASRSPGDFLIYTVTDAQMDEARRAIARDGGKRANALFASLAETRAIFLASSSGVGDPNGRRARLIKRTLSAYLAAAPAKARVLMKFGDVHMAKGVNSLRQRDLGNYVAERADGDGDISLHILVMGAEGQLGVYGGVGQPAPVRPYSPRTDPDYAWLQDVLAARPTGATSDDWTLVDLRKLRGRATADMSPEWHRLIIGYDLVVVAPKLTPATLLGTTG